VLAIRDFLTVCNPNITSDAKVGIHQLAGAACSAFQTAMVNKPESDVVDSLRRQLDEIRKIEDAILME